MLNESYILIRDMKFKVCVLDGAMANTSEVYEWVP
jgi:hypothetical protein